jgi:hypothetical protein
MRSGSFELPRVQGAIARRPDADAVVLQEVLRHLRGATPCQVRGRRGHDEAARFGEAHLDHVALDRLGQADARVVSVGDDVHEPVLRLDLDADPRVPFDEPRKQAGQDERHGHGWDR